MLEEFKQKTENLSFNYEELLETKAASKLTESKPLVFPESQGSNRIKQIMEYNIENEQDYQRREMIRRWVPEYKISDSICLPMNSDGTSKNGNIWESDGIFNTGLFNK